MVPGTGIEPAREFSRRPKSFIRKRKALNINRDACIFRELQFIYFNPDKNASLRSQSMIVICVCRNWFVHIITLNHIPIWWDWQIPFLCVSCLAIVLQIPAWPATRGVPAGTPFFHIRRTLPLNKIDRWNGLPQKRGKRRKARRGDDVHHLFDGCRRDRGNDWKKMENRKRTSPIQDLVFYRQFDEKSNPMSND